MPDCLSVGGGLAAIWMDDSLDKGASHRSTTFDNQTLSRHQEFRVRQVCC